MDINIFQLAMEEQSGGGRGVVATVKRDWPKLWPAQLESNRMYAFDCFAKFWGRNFADERKCRYIEALEICVQL